MASKPDDEFLKLLYDCSHQAYREYTNFMVSKANFSLTLTLALLSVETALLYYINERVIKEIFYLLILILIPSVTIILCSTTNHSLRGAYAHLLEEITTMAKIEEHFGLTKERASKIRLKEDLYFTSTKRTEFRDDLEKKFSTSGRYIDSRVQRIEKSDRYRLLNKIIRRFFIPPGSTTFSSYWLTFFSLELISSVFIVASILMYYS